MINMFLLAILLTITDTGPEQVTLAWDRNPEHQVTDYFLYYGPESRKYDNIRSAGNNTQITVNNMVIGQTYFFAVTAVIESDYSDEISYKIPNPCCNVSLCH